jgi:hypothetical protein
MTVQIHPCTEHIPSFPVQRDEELSHPWSGRGSFNACPELHLPGLAFARIEKHTILTTVLITKLTSTLTGEQEEKWPFLWG